MEWPTPEQWKPLIDQTEPNRPSRGKKVKIIAGKHIGKSGVVFWHGIDKFSSIARYQTNIQWALTEAVGRSGFRVGVQTDNGEKFFCKADYTEVLTQ